MVDETKTVKLPKGYKPTEIISKDFAEGSLYMKKMNLLKGQFAQSHKHKYDHYSILAAGKVTLLKGEDNVEAFKDGYPCDYEVLTAGQEILIKAGETHALIAQENSVWFCIHVTDTEVEDIDKELVVDELS